MLNDDSNRQWQELLFNPLKKQMPEYSDSKFYFLVYHLTQSM